MNRPSEPKAGEGLYVVWASDRRGALALREQVRPSHRQRLRAPSPHAVKVLAAGPTLQVEDGTMNGTLLVVWAASVQDVRAFLDDDPYQRSGVYASVEIRHWHCGLGPWTPVPETNR